MINKKKRYVGIFLVLVLALFFVSFVNAIGVSMYYYEGKPLSIGPGETKQIEVASLIASEETQDKDVEIEILEGSEVASVVNKDVSVVAGSVDNKILLKLSIGEVAEGTEYSVKIRVNEVTAPEGEGMIGFTNSKVTTMPVVVQTPVEPELEPVEGISLTWVIIGIVLIIVVAGIIWFVVKDKKKETSIPVKK